MVFHNYTPHTINLNDGQSFPSLGVARVSASFTDISGLLCRQVLGKAQGLPDPKDDVYLIVSGMVLQASDRNDLVAPATGHPDTIRDEKGHIVSVPAFIFKLNTMGL